MKRFFFIAVAFPLALLVSCGRQEKEAKACQAVKTDKAVPASGETVLQFPGKVKAAQDISIAFRVGGTISRIAVEEGTRVKEGQLLAELDPADYRVQLDATEAEYKQIKAEAERVMALYKENGTTPNDNDKAVYGLKQITAKYQHHKDQLEYTRIYAPFSGFVQKKLFNAHETVGPGMPVISMVSAGIPEVEINLPAADYIRRGDFEGYQCTSELYPGEVYPLRLVSVTPKANANQLYTMRLQMVPGESPLPSPGMNTMVTISCREGDAQPVSVPGGALLRKEGRTYVFVYDASSQEVHSREVTVSRLFSDGRVLVTSEGLKAGDEVVSSGVHHISDGEKVRPLASASETNVGGLL